MIQLRICIDVDDLDRGIAFYGRAFGLAVGRRFGGDFAEMLGGPSPIDLLAKAAGSAPTPTARRDYARHWTPVHLDFVVEDLDAAVARAIGAGATLERPIDEASWGRMASLADPFGHGIDLVEMNERGYDALLDGSP